MPMMVGMQRNRLLVAIAAVLAIIGASAFIVFHDSGSSSAADQQGPSPVHWGFPLGVSGWAYPDKPFYFGLPAVINQDAQGRPARLDSVSLLNPSSGLRIVKLYTNRPNQQTITAVSASLPPRAGEKLYPFAGASVPASAVGEKHPPTVGLGIVMRGPKGPDSYSIDGVVLHYRVGSESYAVTIYDQAIFCTSANADHPTGHCAAPESHGVPKNPPGMGP